MVKSALERSIDSISTQGRAAAMKLQDVSPKKVNKALQIMASLLDSKKELLRAQNKKDLIAGKKNGLSEAMLDRLTLSDKTLATMIQGLNEVIALKCPIGQSFDERIRPNGLKIYKTKVPIGVIAIIYESRPNVTIDAAAICLKSHNAVILRGGSEAFHSNKVLAQLFSEALIQADLPENAVQVIPTTDRKAIELLLQKDEQIDLVIPRGGEGLIRMVVEQSKIPVIKHYKGICHSYVSAKADMKKAIEIVLNAKTQRPGVCNAMETLLLDSALSETKRKAVLSALIENGVTIFGDTATKKLFPSIIQKATDDDWRTEYLDLRLAVRTVKSIDEAIDHINTFGSRHTDAIISESKTEQNKFLMQVDSASVMINTSTRFADGGEYGMGCEIGISTDKLHSRWPMGVEDLTTYKWVVIGNGQIRS